MSVDPIRRVKVSLALALDLGATLMTMMTTMITMTTIMAAKRALIMIMRNLQVMVMVTITEMMGMITTQGTIITTTSRNRFISLILWLSVAAITTAMIMITTMHSNLK